MSFGPWKRTVDRAAVQRVEAWVTGLVDEDVMVTVNEITCAKSGCPPLETVILLLVAGRPTRQLKLDGAVGDLTDHDVREALSRQFPDHR